MGADDIGQLGHAPFMSVQLPSRGLQIGMAQQHLDAAQIDARVEQMCSEGMPQRVRIDWIPDARRLCRIAASQIDGLGPIRRVPAAAGNSHPPGRADRQYTE